jgi:hypothetical protein
MGWDLGFSDMGGYVDGWMKRDEVRWGMDVYVSCEVPIRREMDENESDDIPESGLCAGEFWKGWNSGCI